MISANKKEISMLSETELNMVSGGKWYPWCALFMKGPKASTVSNPERKGAYKGDDQYVTYSLGACAAIVSAAGLVKCAVPSGIFSKLASQVKSIAR